MSVLMLNAQEMRNFINETMPTSTDENGRISRQNVFLVIRRRWSNMHESLKEISKEWFIVLILRVPEKRIVMLN